MRPRALDLFCGAGGATRGLQLAGYRVTGVDIKFRANYCGDQFVTADISEGIPLPLETFDFIWASPPCQAFTNAQKIRGREHPDLVSWTRSLLTEFSTAPFCIENVIGAPLRKPILLCGHMFALRTYRHRWFECSFPIEQPWHKGHEARQAKMGRPPADNEFIQVVGNFSGVKRARDAMGIDWMTARELSQAIPPAYSEYIGRAALAHINQSRAA